MYFFRRLLSFPLNFRWLWQRRQAEQKQLQNLEHVQSIQPVQHFSGIIPPERNQPRHRYRG